MDHPDDPAANDAGSRSRRLRQDLMAQLRAARRRIDPELLAYARQTIERRAGTEGARLRPQGAARPLPIDRQKNMATILKYLELAAGNKSLERRIQALFPRKS